jgi:prephenate dehydrogenase
MNGLARTTGQVRIVGSGLLGASLGHVLTSLGVDVVLDDASRTALSIAVDYGAGRRAAADDAPAVVVVAVPPDATAAVVAAELAAWPDAVVTDVASVKGGILGDLQAAGADLTRYVGSHPMAGRERGGAIAARADLFLGRPWVLAPAPDAGADAVWAVENIAADAGAIPIIMPAQEHDEAVALVSHVPQVVASALAARLRGAVPEAVGLAGGGLRDTTRIAESDPGLWVQILGANSAPVARILRAVRDDLDTAITALDDPDAPGARRALADLLAAGNAGVASIPGKHGRSERFTSITVLIDDRPGELARLLTEIGELGVNMEDLRLEHSPSAQIGLAEIAIVPEAEAGLVDALIERGWRIAGGAE